jgi:hypothetical protein
MHDLNQLVDSPEVVKLERAWAINNGGQIVVHGRSPVATVSFLLTPIRRVADIDSDCEVGIRDLLMLLAAFSPCSGAQTCFEDVNHDEVVDEVDLGLLLDNWG